MSAIVAEKNEFQRTLEQLNDWEKKSIAKVQQRAATLREKLLELTMSHRRQLAEKLQHLSTQIKDDDFTENDLRRWKKILDDLKKDYLSPSIISIDEYMKDPLVKDIYVASLFTNELFLKVSDENVRIEENGQLAIHNTSLNTTGIRGRNVYSTGCHQIRLRIEHSNNKWAIFDCDEHLIMMINERSKARYELPIQIDHCPLPWQLHIALHEPNNRLRILRE